MFLELRLPEVRPSHTKVAYRLDYLLYSANFFYVQLYIFNYARLDIVGNIENIKCLY